MVRTPFVTFAVTSLSFAAMACSTTTSPNDVAQTSSSVPATSAPAETEEFTPTLHEFEVPSGAGPHDVAPAPDGGAWYTAQRSGELGYLEPSSGSTRHISLGRGSSPHGVIVGPDGAPWITDGGLNAIVRVDPRTDEVRTFPIDRPRVNLNTATFDGGGVLWFTGQEGYYGRLDPRTGEVETFTAPKGRALRNSNRS